MKTVRCVLCDVQAISPDEEILTALDGLPELDPTFSMAFTTSMPNKSGIREVLMSGQQSQAQLNDHIQSTHDYFSPKLWSFSTFKNLAEDDVFAVQPWGCHCGNEEL